MSGQLALAVAPAFNNPPWLIDALKTHGLGADLLENLQCSEREALYKHHPKRGNLTIGWHDGRNWHDAAVVDTYRYDELVAYVTDRDKFAVLLVSAVKAIPALFQPRLPAWAYLAARAADDLKHRQRAARLADRAARGQPASKTNYHEDSLAPF